MSVQVCGPREARLYQSICEAEFAGQQVFQNIGSRVREIPASSDFDRRLRSDREDADLQIGQVQVRRKDG